MTIDYHLW